MPDTWYLYYIVHNRTALQRPTAVGKDETVVNFMLTHCQKFHIKNLIIIIKQQ